MNRRRVGSRRIKADRLFLICISRRGHGGAAFRWQVAKLIRNLVITATASRSFAKLSAVPSTCPMLAVLTTAST
jgi:hypothetical protein